ncbi:Alpha/Beta hydrolase protein [Xylariaceae sp. FL0804]|nr:Alpha/Beta hydrolase protein [Xylariaceae sp. FL0804]
MRFPALSTPTALAVLASSAAAPASAACTSSGAAAGLQVNTTSGVVRGTVNATAPGVRQFLGIPYASPPVGGLRFAPPAPYRRPSANEHQQVIDASAFAPSCVQPVSTPAADAANLYVEYLTGFQLGSPAQSEDCLYANVYAPRWPATATATAGRLLPVFIWIHGGAFTSDGANVPYQIPAPWIERTQGHIVVTFNYRLNVFGFPNAEAQGLNLGLLDQRLAVEWVRDNVAAFGGDPERMVLWGQSAGAWAVNYYGYAYPDDPIVAGLIADSGGSTVFSTGDPANFTALAAAVGCDLIDPAAQLDCVRRVDTAAIEGFASNLTGVSWGPGADNVTVFADYAERAARGLVAPLPKIIGNNAREGDGFGNWTAQGGISEADLVTASAIIVCPTVEEIQIRLNNSLPTYRYYYSGNFSNITPLPWIGAVHSGELPLLFGTDSEYNGVSTKFEQEVSHTMEGLWLSFATNTKADPSYASFTWPKYSSNTNSMASFAENTTVVGLGNGTAVSELFCSLSA